VAVPFVQGRLRNEALSVDVASACVHCRRALHLEIDSEARVRVVEPEAEPWICIPIVDFKKLRAPNIIDDF